MELVSRLGAGESRTRALGGVSGSGCAVLGGGLGVSRWRGVPPGGMCVRAVRRLSPAALPVRKVTAFFAHGQAFRGYFCLMRNSRDGGGVCCLMVGSHPVTYAPPPAAVRRGHAMAAAGAAVWSLGGGRRCAPVFTSGCFSACCGNGRGTYVSFRVNFAAALPWSRGTSAHASPARFLLPYGGRNAFLRPSAAAPGPLAPRHGLSGPLREPAGSDFPKF